MPLPDFLIIGAPKAGTTALHAALATHPALYMSPVKEPKFFLTDGPPPTLGGGPGDIPSWRENVWRQEDYESLFARHRQASCAPSPRPSTCMTGMRSAGSGS